MQEHCISREPDPFREGIDRTTGASASQVVSEGKESTCFMLEQLSGCV